MNEPVSTRVVAPVGDVRCLGCICFPARPVGHLPDFPQITPQRRVRIFPGGSDGALPLFQPRDGDAVKAVEKEILVIIVAVCVYLW